MTVGRMRTRRVSISFAVTHLEVGFCRRSAADPVDAVVPVRRLGQRQVSLAHVFALSQRHVAHQQQPLAIARVALCVLQAGAAGGGAGDAKVKTPNKSV